MVPFFRSSKPKRKKVDTTGIMLSGERIERFVPSPGEIARTLPPVERLWEEKGILETYQDNQREMFEKVKGSLDRGTLDAKQRGKIDEIEDILERDEFHDRVSKHLVFDLFDRSWGTEVMAYVWWAGWDDIVVTTFGDAFLIETDLGPQREVKMTPNFTMTLGGRNHIYFKQQGLVFPEPELRLGNETLHLLFAGVTVPEGPRTYSVGASFSLTGKELMAQIERGWEDFIMKNPRISPYDP